MNKWLLPTFLVLGLTTVCALGQGTMIFDQQDSTMEGSPQYGSFGSIQGYTPPWGQSFTPTFSGIDFIRLELVDGNQNDGLGADVLINLMSGSISGPIIGTTDTVAMTNGFSGPVSFLFPMRVSLTPGVKYFFEPVQTSGGPWNIVAESFIYPGGDEYNNGVIHGGGDLWFREGIIAPVPEPSSFAFLVLAGGVVFLPRTRGSAMNWLVKLLAMLAVVMSAHGQGTVVFDQQDSTMEGSPPYGSFGSIQSLTPPWGQSFTPTLSGVDFIRLELIDGNQNDGLGANFFVNLMSGSISGPIIGTTATVALTNGFSDAVSFFFPTRVSLTPGVKYFFEPVEQSGGLWNIESGGFIYPGGDAYNNGVIHGGSELWFREGIIAPVPEPSSVALLSLAAALLIRRIRPCA